MKVLFYDAHCFEKEVFLRHCAGLGIKFDFLEAKLDPKTVLLAEGHDAICVFTNDKVDEAVIKKLSNFGIKLIALRCAGFNNIDLAAAKKNDIPVVRVPEYSAHAIAEHALALILALNRKIHRAHNRIREGNFSLSGLMGFDLFGKTIGVFGTGKIGGAFCKIMLGMGCKVIAFDPFPNKGLESLGVKYLDKDEVFKNSDVISLHMPLMPETKYIVNKKSIDLMKDGVMIINTSRGGLVDTKALVEGLKTRKIAHAGLDVYEEEEGLFFDDHSNDIITDDLFARLVSFPNVLVTSHQAFLTNEATDAIAQITIDNIMSFLEKNELKNSV